MPQQEGEILCFGVGGGRLCMHRRDTHVPFDATTLVFVHLPGRVLVGVQVQSASSLNSRRQGTRKMLPSLQHRVSTAFKTRI